MRSKSSSRIPVSKPASRGAVIAYALQMLSFILLRLRRPNMVRPYRSPFGVPGAVIALVIAVVTLVALFVVDEDYRLGALGALIWYVAGLIYFAVYARKRLVLAPEEQFAEHEDDGT